MISSVSGGIISLPFERHQFRVNLNRMMHVPDLVTCEDGVAQWQPSTPHVPFLEATQGLSYMHQPI